jgi:hypothetical protein
MNHLLFNELFKRRVHTHVKGGKKITCYLEMFLKRKSVVIDSC